MGEAEIVVSMLWEDVGPHTTLAERFGFDSSAAAARWISDLTAQHWPLGQVRVNRLVLSAANALAWLDTSEGPRIAKWCVTPQRFAQLRRAIRVTNWLSGEGVPVSPFLPARAGPAHIEADGCLVGLQRVVAGDLLCVDDPAQVHEAGAVLARLHLTLARCPEPLPARDPLFGDLPDFVALWLGAAPATLSAGAVARLRALLDAAPPLDSTPQWVHGDYRSANLLVHRGGIQAILDFEEIGVDHPVSEVTRAAVHLGTRYRNWAPVPDSVHATFRAGYESVRPFTASEAAWWDVLVPWYGLSRFGDR